MKTLSRRTVALGAAWAVPVITVGAAAPFASASPPPVVITQPTGDGGGCKNPGQSVKGFDYAYHLNLNVTTPVDGVVALASATAPGGSVTPLDGQTFAVSATGTNLISVVIFSSNSANGTATLIFTFAGQTVPVTVSFGQGFNPCKK